MENTKVCQSCEMPMNGQEELRGTNADGSYNDDYCVYCYKDGAFTADISMDAMIEDCIPHMIAAVPGLTEEAARQSMKETFPNLKRWQKENIRQ